MNQALLQIRAMVSGSSGRRKVGRTSPADQQVHMHELRTDVENLRIQPEPFSKPRMIKLRENTLRRLLMRPERLTLHDHRLQYGVSGNASLADQIMSGLFDLGRIIRLRRILLPVLPGHETAET